MIKYNLGQIEKPAKNNVGKSPFDEDYDNAKNPFADDLDLDDTNPFKDDYDKNLNPFET